MDCTEARPKTEEAGSKSRPLVIEPVSGEYDDERFTREYVTGGPLTKAEKATVAIYGHHPAFCDLEGQTVEDHGHWCHGPTLLAVSGRWMETGGDARLHGSVVQPYHHGAYRKEDMPPPNERLVRLVLTGDGVVPAANDNDFDEGQALVLPVGEVRRMIAALSRLADIADLLELAGCRPA